MKNLTKRLSLIIALLLLSAFAFSSCADEIEKVIVPESKIVVNNLGNEDIGFRVTTELPLYDGWMYFSQKSNVIAGKTVKKFKNYDTGNHRYNHGKNEYAQAWLIERLKLSKEDFVAKYGDVIRSYFYNDVTVIVTKKYDVEQSRPDLGFAVTVILLNGDEIKENRFHYTTEHINFLFDDKEFMYRYKDKILFNNSQIIDIKTAEIKDATEEDILKMTPPDTKATAFVKAEGFAKNAKDLGDYNVFALEHSVLLSEEINGRIYIALTRKVDGVEALYGYIFDSESGELLYAVEMKAQKDSGAKFIFAEPVIPTKDGYFEIHR